jgi:uroporphyrinogen III methyltransferase/synthase
MDKTNGKIYLIGAGPGDPGLITVKAAECIKAADVVVYDYLAAPALLSYAREDAEIIYVGKKGGDHTLTQDKINDLIVEKAKRGLNVARLKGGDPFIFGRGGEECEELLEASCSFEIVPGVTSAIAAPAYAGIPLTHRRFASSVSIITGHEDPTKKDSSINWKVLAQMDGTLVFLMGVKNLGHITTQLMENGKDKETPVALVRWGTTTKQRSVTGTLSNIVDVVEKAKIKSPSIIVVGGVVTLKDTLKWFEDRPLFGKKIIVTRAREQASDLVKLLTDLGAECIECPTIKVVEPDETKALDNAISNIAKYKWLIFTSVNGVKYFFDKLFEKGLDVRALGSLKTATIGPATSQKLLDYGIKSDVIPETYRAESVVEAFKEIDVKDKNILLPRALEARSVLPEELTKMGANIDDVASYQTVTVHENKDLLISELEDGNVDMVTFTSSSTVKNFKGMIPDDRFKELTSKLKVASIGPITSDTAKDLDFEIATEAKDFTIPGLTDAILKFYS